MTEIKLKVDGRVVPTWPALDAAITLQLRAILWTMVRAGHYTGHHPLTGTNYEIRGGRHKVWRLTVPPDPRYIATAETLWEIERAAARHAESLEAW